MSIHTYLLSKLCCPPSSQCRHDYFAQTRHWRFSRPGQGDCSHIATSWSASAAVSRAKLGGWMHLPGLLSQHALLAGFVRLVQPIGSGGQLHCTAGGGCRDCFLHVLEWGVVMQKVWKYSWVAIYVASYVVILNCW